MTDVAHDLAINGQIASATSFTGKKRIRKSFGRIPEAVQMPNLIEVQRASYEQFLQREVRPGQRRDEGIEAVFKSVFPIKDFNERAILEYVSYEFEEPKYDVEECIQRDMTYAAPLKVKLRLIVWSLLQIVRKRGTLLPSDEIKMLEWSNDLVAFHKAASLTDAAARRAAQRDVQLRMIEEYARCAVHNRRQNAVKISERSAGFTWLAGLMVLSIGTAASLALWKALY